MKTTQNPQPPIFAGKYMSCALILALGVIGFESAQAAVFTKADNANALNLPTSWVNIAVPTSGDIALWDSAVTALNTTNTLGANLTWGGIKINSPAANIQINAGNSLTNGAYGIDMTAATVNLALSNTVCIAPGALQQWNVAPGYNLSLAAIPIKPGQPANNTGVLQVGTTGTVQLGTVAAATIYDNNGNSWMTYGQNDWAALDGSGNVIAATYTTVSAAPLVAGVFNDIVGDVAGGAGSAVDMPGIRFNDSAFHTVGIANSGTSRTMTCRGILVTSNSGGGLIGGQAATSFIRPSRTTIANTAWNVIQNSPADFTISAIISNGSSSAPTHLVKSGPGNLIISYPANGYSGGSDINGGTLTTAAGASLGGGAVTVNNTGRLVVNASNTTFVASVTVNSGGTNKININTANAQQYISSVTFNAGSTACGFSYATGVGLSTTTAPLAVTNVTANGSIMVNIYCGSPAVGVFPLIKYTNSLAGTGFPAFSLGIMPLRTLGYLSNDVANASIDLVVTNITEPLNWAVGDGIWDLATTPNWKDSLGTVTTYQEANGYGDVVVFEDTQSGTSPVLVTDNSTLKPATVTVNAAKNYSILGSGSIAGTASFTKSGTGTLTLQTANSFSGGLNINGGVLNFSALTNLGAGAISFGGGTLQYNGNSDDISVRTVTFNPGGGTIDTAGQTVTFANPVGSGAGGGLTKAGAGTLTLTGTNKYVGNTVVANGTLALAGNTYISNSAAIIVNGVLDTASSGVNLGLNSVVNQILGGTGTVNGSVIAPALTTLSPATNGVYGTLSLGNDLTISGATLAMDISSGSRDQINVSGNLTLNSGSLHLNVSGLLPNGTYKLISYGGSLASGSGSSGALVVSGFSQAGKSATLSDATAGEIDLIVADGASDTITWAGTGSSWDLASTPDWLLGGVTPWAFTNGDLVTFNDLGSGSPTVLLQSSLLPSTVTVNNTTIPTYTFADGTGVGGGKIAGTASLVKDGTGTLIIQTANSYTGPTTIKNGTLQIGNGGIGDIGTGNITNNGVLVFAQGDGNTHTVPASITGTGSVMQQGSSAVVLANNNTYTGSTTITSGSLQVGTGGAVGSLGSGAITNSGTLIYNKTGTYSVGSIKTGTSGGGALTFNGVASVTLNGGNTYQNNTAVQNGTVTLSAGNIIPSAATVSGSTGWLVLDGGAASAGVLDMNGFDQTVNSLSGLGNTVNGAITNITGATTTTNILTVLGSAGTTYNGSIIGNPSGPKIGLTLLGANELRLNGNCSYTGPTLVGSGATLGVGPGYVTSTGLTILSNNATFSLHANGSTAVFPGNNIYVADNSAGSIISSAAGNGFGGTVAGGVTATNIIGPNLSFSTAAVKQFQGMNGTVLVSATGSIRFSSTSLSVNGGENAMFDVEGTINTRNGSGATTGNGIYLGGLTGAGTLSGGGVSVSSVTTYIIGAKGVDSSFTGSIVNGSQGNVAIVKVGTGKLTLNGQTALVVSSPDGGLSYVTNSEYANTLITYTGNTTISNGVLKLVAPVVLTSSPSITLSSSTAVLDASQMGFIDTDGSTYTNLVTNGVFEVVSGQTLAGLGTINASNVVLDAGSILNVGQPLGSLTATKNVELAGTVNMNVNATNISNASKLLAQNLTIDGTASLVVTNLGSENAATFQLFNHPVNFPSVVLPTLSGTNTWVNNLAVDGSLTLIAPVIVSVNTNSTNIVISVGGGNLTLNWPADHTGWRLQTQTNSLAVGISTNWVDVAGATLTNQIIVPINSTNGSVFYRMVYP